MPSSKEPYRGRVQAQGDDIKKPKGGYSHSWAQQKPVTDQEGLFFLDKIEEQCTKSQKEKRKRCFLNARNFIKRAGE